MNRRIAAGLRRKSKVKIKEKQRLEILNRAYDKATKVLPGKPVVLADLERSVLAASIDWSRRLAHERRQSYRHSVWEHFGWNEPAEVERFHKMLEEIRNGQRV
jgi:hypothetical protein